MNEKIIPFKTPRRTCRHGRLAAPHRDECESERDAYTVQRSWSRGRAHQRLTCEHGTLRPRLGLACVMLAMKGRAWDRSGSRLLLGPSLGSGRPPMPLLPLHCACYRHLCSGTDANGLSHCRSSVTPLWRCTCGTIPLAPLNQRWY